MIAKTRSGTIYEIEEVDSKYLIKSSTSRFTNYILSQECSKPVIGQPLIINSVKNDTQYITSEVLEVRWDI